LAPTAVLASISSIPEPVMADPVFQKT